MSGTARERDRDREGNRNWKKIRHKFHTNDNQSAVAEQNVKLFVVKKVLSNKLGNIRGIFSRYIMNLIRTFLATGKSQKRINEISHLKAE